MVRMTRRKAELHMDYHERNLVEQLVFIHAKVAVILWGIAYLIYPSQGVLDELGHGLIYASAFCAIVGSLMGIGGLILSNSKFLKRRHQGNILEFAGLQIAIVGPLAYCFTVATLAFKIEAPGYLPVAFFAYALAGFMFSRVVVVWRQVKDQL